VVAGEGCSRTTRGEAAVTRIAFGVAGIALAISLGCAAAGGNLAWWAYSLDAFTALVLTYGAVRA
jgi:hypothetical protein